MKQLNITILLTMLMSIVVTTASAHDAEVDGIYYNLNTSSQTATVTYRGSTYSSYSDEYTGNVVIPESVTYDNKTYNVMSIGGGAFEGCSGLTSITIPNSVTSIGRYAFLGTAWYDNQPNGLVYAGNVAYTYKGTMPQNTSIVLKEGTLGIAGNAFSDCSRLTSITIPNSVTSIGDNAFYDCTSLTSITIGNSVTSIGHEAFSGCSSLTSISIPNSVTSIEAMAFYNCTGLKSVKLPNGITRINGLVFCNTGLTSIEIPNSVTSIGGDALSYCSSLTSIIIPESVESIEFRALEYTPWYNNQPNGVVYAGKVAYKYKGTMPEKTAIKLKEGTLGIAESAFYGCSGLTSITIPNSVISIEESTFRDCTSLTSIDIPNSVISIEKSAFRDCTSLTSIDIPNSVTSIGDNAFKGCSKLTSVTIPNSVTSIGGYAFSACSGLTSVTIPNSVTSIGLHAFNCCSGLTSITIPNSVTSIGYDVFSGCTALTSIYSYIENPTNNTGSNFDNSNYSNATLYVPYGTKDKYQSTDGWKNFAKIVEMSETAVKGISASNINEAKYYSLDGKQFSQPQKGLNILKMSDGSTRKVVK